MNIYRNYEEYIQHQSQKASNPEKRERLLNNEWISRIEGFEKEFSKFGNFLTSDKKCLCLGAKTGQEIVSLQKLGIKDVFGIDLIPSEPLVNKGDIHNLSFEDDTFDFIYTSIIDHSIDPKRMISEAERVLKEDGIFFLQIRLDQNQKTVFEIKDPIYDVATLFDKSYCLAINHINNNGETNFVGMNVELIFRKDKTLTQLFNKYGNLRSIHVPVIYENLWNDINLDIQNKKLDSSRIFEEEKRENILNTLKKRAFYLTRIAELHGVKKIVEVGTAEGWQFFSFGEYAKEAGGVVYSCDPRNVRSEQHSKDYQDVCFYYQSTSKELGSDTNVHDVEMFYIDGLHDENTVITDVVNLINTQSTSNAPIWIFDDFDDRFGAFKDILQLLRFSNGFKIWNVGMTASGQPSHQVLVKNRFLVKKD